LTIISGLWSAGSADLVLIPRPCALNALFFRDLAPLPAAARGEHLDGLGEGKWPEGNRPPRRAGKPDDCFICPIS